MNDNIKNFEEHWVKLKSKNGCEMHIDLLTDLAIEDGEVLCLVVKKFKTESNENNKELLAMIAHGAGLKEP